MDSKPAPTSSDQPQPGSVWDFYETLRIARMNADFHEICLGNSAIVSKAIDILLAIGGTGALAGVISQNWPSITPILSFWVLLCTALRPLLGLSQAIKIHTQLLGEFKRLEGDCRDLLIEINHTSSFRAEHATRAKALWQNFKNISASQPPLWTSIHKWILRKSERQAAKAYPKAWFPVQM